MRGRPLAAAIVLLATAAPAEASREERCRPAGSATVAASGEVRVYARRGFVTACAYAGRRRTRLGPTPARADAIGSNGVAEVRVRGRYVAFRTEDLPESSQGPYSVDELELRDARTGRRTDLGDEGCRRPIDWGNTGRLVPSFDLTATGRVAWTCYAGPLGHAVVEVHRYDADGPALLDRRDPAEGPDPIDAHSLAIAASPSAVRHWVYWSSAAGPHAALLR